MTIPQARMFSPFLTDIAVTGLTVAAVAACNISLIRMISRGLGPEEFGAYALVRRTVATFVPFTSLSLGIGVARFMGLYRGTGQGTQAILPSAVIVSSVFCLLVCAGLLPFAGLAGEMIFNQGGREVLFGLILFVLVGENLYDCLYSYYRGGGNMHRANALNMLLVGILPVCAAALLVHTNSVSHIVFGIGLVFYLCAFSLVPKVCRGIAMTTWNELSATAKNLVRYSAPRAPGGVALSLIFTFGVLVSPHIGGIAGAAYLSIGIWIFQMLQAATAPFGLVVLPKAATLVGRGSEDYLIQKLRSVYDFVLHVGLFAVIQGFISADFLVSTWLGAGYSEAVPTTRIIILSMIPFLFYTMMRSIIDGVEKRAVNAFNVYLGLSVTVAASLILTGVDAGLTALAIGLDMGIYSLGVMTHVYLYRRYRVKVVSGRFYFTVLVNTALGSLVYLVKYGLLSNEFNYRNVAIVLSIQVLCGALYLFILRRSGAAWIRDVEQRVSLRVR
ncbi:MAG: lipopolysaccharide biosynthesis protein [Thermodesulfobacteriota bacterium]